MVNLGSDLVAITDRVIFLQIFTLKYSETVFRIIGIQHNCWIISLWKKDT